MWTVEPGCCSESSLKENHCWTCGRLLFPCELTSNSQVSFNLSWPTWRGAVILLNTSSHHVPLSCSTSTSLQMLLGKQTCIGPWEVSSHRMNTGGGYRRVFLKLSFPGVLCENLSWLAASATCKPFIILANIYWAPLVGMGTLLFDFLRITHLLYKMVTFWSPIYKCWVIYSISWQVSGKSHALVSILSDSQTPALNLRNSFLSQVSRNDLNRSFIHLCVCSFTINFRYLPGAKSTRVKSRKMNMAWSLPFRELLIYTTK